MRNGYYVEGHYYGNKYAQAMARARLLANTYGRGVDLKEVKPGASVPEVVYVAWPQRVAA